MPAVDLERVRTKLSLLADPSSNLASFITGLRGIYEFYTDLTHPVGDVPSRVYSRPSFNTPAILNKEILSVFRDLCNGNPHLTLSLADALWQQPEVELHQLSAQLLGSLPISSMQAVMDRIRSWSANDKDAELLPFLHHHASATIRRQDPQAWLHMLTEWSRSDEPWLVTLSIQGVIPLINDPDFENLPAIFSFLSPLLLNLAPQYQFDLLRSIETLTARSEKETVFFLKNIASLSDDPQMPRFLRRTMDKLSKSAQDSLRKSLRERQESA